tara:strand:- start:518 stop:1444 length:927 start_codon:yes stop_codon:yes gene_type:complete
MTIPIEELQQTNPSAIIDLFELELVEGLHYATGNPLGITTVYRWHSGVAQNSQGELVFNSNTYSQMPIEAEGFDYKGSSQKSSLPRPTLRISNLLSTVSTILAEINGITPHNDLIGAKVTRFRTMAKFISSTNLSGQTITYVVTVQNVGGANYFYLNGVYKPTLSLVEGNTYRFVQSDSTNTGHPLILKNSSGSQLNIRDNVVRTGTAGIDGVLSYTVTLTNQAARYSCSVHGNNMGNTISVSAAPSNPDEDPNVRFEDMIFIIDRKSTENRRIVEFELAAPIDMPQYKLPRRQCLPREFPGIGSFHA